MSSSRTQRLGRLAACTALALSASSLIVAGQASAAGKATDRPTGSSAAPSAAAPKARVPHPAAPAAGVVTAPKPAAKGLRAAPPQTLAASSVPQPRLDLNGDGFSELVFRTTRGYTGAFESNGSTRVDVHIDGENDETVKDIIALGNAGGGWNPEVLTWTFDGKLQLRETSGSSVGAPVWTGTGWQIYNRVIAAADLNRDGRPDLLARTPSGDLYLYKGTGDLTKPFTDRVKVSSGWEQYDQILGVNDVDGDGAADVIGRTGTGDLYFHKGTGNAAAPFAARTQIATGWTFYSQLIAGDDIDGDGKADLLGVTESGDLFCHFSEGNGKFTWQTNCGSNWTNLEMFAGASITPVYGKHSLGALDTNGQAWSYDNLSNGGFYEPRTSGSFVWPTDGSKLVLASGMDKVNWGHQFQFNQWGLTNRTTGQNIAGDWWGVTNLIVGGGDVSGDGKGDLLTRDVWGNLYVHQGDGTGNKFAAPVNVGSGWDQYNAIAAGDFNGDGIADVVGNSNVNGAGHLYFHQGTGKASAPFSARREVSGGSEITQLTSPGDLNADGKADLVMVDASGHVSQRTAGNASSAALFNGARALYDNWTYRNVS
ncbi:VCBS repeat-containing protein [Streptomyces sp. G-G2]|uniref:FG-GAP repeat domain-containing protein n=1 Tax=Streptomyces sp. G-G2 TaxID=3046201 RepID=UPI0024B8EB96|nr:VCBS repeat-containing protein [Streptomyces sp. G-G2]MDJ0380579.1 VCBS repeat-containing protein [Streptomyces sp. G-G2]